MAVMIVDGQGGGIGKSLIEEIKEKNPDLFVIAVGTNATAAGVMKRAGADVAATGENPVV